MTSTDFLQRVQNATAKSSLIFSPLVPASHLISSAPILGRMGRHQATLRVSPAFHSEFSLVVA
jgi:hypothetical protein